MHSFERVVVDQGGILLARIQETSRKWIELVKTTLLDFDTVTAVSALTYSYCTSPILWEYYFVAGGKIL